MASALDSASVFGFGIIEGFISDIVLVSGDGLRYSSQPRGSSARFLRPSKKMVGASRFAAGESPDGEGTSSMRRRPGFGGRTSSPTTEVSPSSLAKLLRLSMTMVVKSRFSASSSLFMRRGPDDCSPFEGGAAAPFSSSSSSLLRNGVLSIGNPVLTRVPTKAAATTATAILGSLRSNEGHEGAPARIPTAELAPTPMAAPKPGAAIFSVTAIAAACALAKTRSAALSALAAS